MQARHFVLFHYCAAAQSVRLITKRIIIIIDFILCVCTPAFNQPHVKSVHMFSLIVSDKFCITHCDFVFSCFFICERILVRDSV